MRQELKREGSAQAMDTLRQELMKWKKEKAAKDAKVCSLAVFLPSL